MKTAKITSFHVAPLLAKDGKALEGETVTKEAFLDVVFRDFNLTEIILAIKEVQLSRPTVTRRVEIKKFFATPLQQLTRLHLLRLNSSYWFYMQHIRQS